MTAVLCTCPLIKFKNHARAEGLMYQSGCRNNFISSSILPDRHVKYIVIYSLGQRGTGRDLSSRICMYGEQIYF